MSTEDIVSDLEQQAASTTTDSLASLKRFASLASRAEHCELCGVTVSEYHPHLLDRISHVVICGCQACAILFANQPNSRFLRIPIQVRAVCGLECADLEWQALAIPIDLVFFVRDFDGRLKAIYPSPAGAIESSLPLDTIDNILNRNQAVARMLPEVEALLVSRMVGEEFMLVVPIDECFRLTGLIRLKWRGLSGGTEVRAALKAFFAELQRRAGLTGSESHA